MARTYFFKFPLSRELVSELQAMRGVPGDANLEDARSMLHRHDILVGWQQYNLHSDRAEQGDTAAMRLLQDIVVRVGHLQRNGSRALSSACKSSFDAGLDRTGNL